MLKPRVFRIAVVPIVASAIAFLLFISDTGSVGKRPTQPEDHLIIRTAGVDLSEHVEGGLRLTLGGPLSLLGGAEEAGPQTIPYIVSGDGLTLFDANRQMHMRSELNPFWGHIMFLIIGEEAAKAGVSRYLDMIIRDHESRFTVMS